MKNEFCHKELGADFVRNSNQTYAIALHPTPCRPRFGGSKSEQLQRIASDNHTLHRPRVGGWATFGFSSRLHRRMVGAGQSRAFVLLL